MIVKKKKYISPDMEIDYLENSAILTASGDEEDFEHEVNPWGN